MNPMILRALLAVLITASSLLAQPVRISEPRLAERFVREAVVATDGIRHLVAFQTDGEGAIYATPVDANGWPTGEARRVAVPDSHTLTALVRTEDRYLLIAERRSLSNAFSGDPRRTNSMEVVELDGDGATVGRWEPIALDQSLTGAWWIEGSLRLGLRTPGNSASPSVAIARRDGELEGRRSFPAQAPYFFLPVGAHWYGLTSSHETTHRLRVHRYDGELQQLWSTTLEAPAPFVASYIATLAPLPDGGVLAAWEEVAGSKRMQLGRISRAGEVTRGSNVELPLSCHPRHWPSVHLDHGDAVLITGLSCGEGGGGWVMTRFDPASLIVAESQRVTFPHAVVPGSAASGLTLGFELAIASDGYTATFPLQAYRLLALPNGGAATPAYPALAPAAIYQSAVASWKGRTTAAWIESTAAGDRLVVARIGAAETTVLLERPLLPRNSNVAIESSPEVDLVVWRIDRELHSMRFDAAGAPVDASPLWIGHTRSHYRPGIAWNGSSFLVVWGSSLINGARVPPSGGASYLGIIWVGTPDPGRSFTVESPSIAWNGSGYLMTYLGYQTGMTVLVPEPRRRLYYSLLDANAVVVGSVPWRIHAPEVSFGHLTEWLGGRQSSPAPVRSDGGEYVVAHSSEIGAQLFRISASGQFLGEETIDWWGRPTGQIVLDTAGEGEGYALAVLRPTESGSILILDRLDSNGTRIGVPRAHRLEHQPVDLDVAMVAEEPLAAFGGNDGALMTASTEGSSSVPLPPPPPEVSSERGMLRWLPVEGALGYIVTVFNFNGELSYRRIFGPETHEWLVFPAAGTRPTVQTIGADGVSEAVEPARLPRRRAVGR